MLKIAYNQKVSRADAVATEQLHKYSILMLDSDGGKMDLALENIFFIATRFGLISSALR